MCIHTFRPLDPFIQDHVLYGSGTVPVSVSSLYTHTFSTWAKWLLHIYWFLKRWKIMDSVFKSAPCSHRNIHPYQKKKPHTHTFLPLLHHVSLIHKVKAYAVCWSGGNAINLALIYFTSFCCCPGLDDFSQDLRSLTVWSHHTTNPHHTNSRSIGHSVIWRMTAARYFYSLNNKFPFCTFSRTPTWSWYSQLNTITDDIAWSTNLETWHISPFKKKTFLSSVCCEYLNRDATEYE